MKQPVLEVNDLVVEFHTHEGVVKAVNKLSYTLPAKQTLGIVGESGSGKSVSSMALMDLLPKPPAVIGKGSSIKIQGQEITGWSRKQLRSMRGPVMSMIFQDPMTSLNPFVRIDKQMTEALIFHRGFSKRAALKKAAQMMEFVQVPDVQARLKAYPHELSGGMRQRVMIAMALTCDPKIIFADEPTTALDVTVQAQILKLFRRMQTEFNSAIVLISHDLGVIATEAQQILVMYAGQMMEYGSPEDIFDRTAHPYTVALKQSIPELYPEGEAKERLAAIKGLPPNLLHLGKGCPFAPRCQFAKAECQEEVAVKQIGPGHFSRCNL
jgi:oligopeptide transport system ATP-binding protein